MAAFHGFTISGYRDNCRSTERFDPVTKERKALTESIPSKLIASEIAITGAEIRIKWSDESVDSRFDAHWLKRNSYDMAEISTKAPKQFWGSEYGSSLESFAYDEVMSDDNASAEMIAAFEAFGLVRLTDMPTTDREVERFANRLSYVREIAFNRVADIRVSMDPYTLGVTNAALPLHTDCFAYSCPPNVMAFHCLQNDVAGGASLYVDGANVVAQLRQTNPEALQIMTDYAVEFRLWSKKADTMSLSPPVILDERGELALLRYAN